MNDRSRDSERQPWLSVVIPVYNAERFLDECLGSIRKQTFGDFEVIMVDDGSKDGSGDICRKFARNDSRFRYIRKENGGAYQTRIFGAERARGEYVTFSDSDDFYLTDQAFARIHEEVTASNCQALQFVFTKKFNHLKHKVVTTREAFNADRALFLEQEYPLLLASSWEGSHLSTNAVNKVYHRSLIANLPSSDNLEKVFWGDDQIMNMYLLSTCESIRFIPDTLYCYRQFYGGTSAFNLHTMKDVDTIKKHQLEHLAVYQGSATERIQKNLFSELAGWFFYHVRQALERVSEDEVTAMINEVLQYPRFVLAREYFMNRPDDKRDAVELLRKADAREYIRAAKAFGNDRSAKDALMKLLKRIYAAI